MRPALCHKNIGSVTLAIAANLLLGFGALAQTAAAPATTAAKAAAAPG